MDVVDLGIVVTQGATRKRYIHKVKYRCVTCGDWVEAQKQAFDKYGARNCRGCSAKLKAKQVGNSNKLRAAKKFSDKVLVKFSGTIDCTSSIYIDQDTPVVAFCSIHQEYFERTPHSILQGYACPLCGAEKKDYSKRRKLQDPALLYFIHFIELDVYKLGVTTTTISRRYSAEPEAFDIIFAVAIPTAEYAYNLERFLLEKYIEYKYTGPSVLKSGNTECFTTNIDEALLLDTQIYLDNLKEI